MGRSSSSAVVHLLERLGTDVMAAPAVRASISGGSLPDADHADAASTRRRAGGAGSYHVDVEHVEMNRYAMVG